uniref:Secreted protein n=1 Tax=Romanomermis culicivorax TaxID=13658 RepID=A0A915JE62_ROMCU
MRIISILAANFWSSVHFFNDAAIDRPKRSSSSYSFRKKKSCTPLLLQQPFGNTICRKSGTVAIPGRVVADRGSTIGKSQAYFYQSVKLLFNAVRRGYRNVFEKKHSYQNPLSAFRANSLDASRIGRRYQRWCGRRRRRRPQIFPSAVCNGCLGELSDTGGDRSFSSNTLIPFTTEITPPPAHGLSTRAPASSTSLTTGIAAVTPFLLSESSLFSSKSLFTVF